MKRGNKWIFKVFPKAKTNVHKASEATFDDAYGGKITLVELQNNILPLKKTVTLSVIILK